MSPNISAGLLIYMIRPAYGRGLLGVSSKRPFIFPCEVTRTQVRQKRRYEFTYLNHDCKIGSVAIVVIPQGNSYLFCETSQCLDGVRSEHIRSFQEGDFCHPTITRHHLNHSLSLYRPRYHGANLRCW